LEKSGIGVLGGDLVDQGGDFADGFAVQTPADPHQ
jgi:hypothetical protein